MSTLVKLNEFNLGSVAIAVIGSKHSEMSEFIHAVNGGDATDRSLINFSLAPIEHKLPFHLKNTTVTLLETPLLDETPPPKHALRCLENHLSSPAGKKYILAGIIYLHPIYEAQGGDFLDSGDLDLVENICGASNLLIVLTARGTYPQALPAYKKIHEGKSDHGSTFTLAKQRGVILSDLDFTVAGSTLRILQSLPFFSEPTEGNQGNSGAIAQPQRDEILLLDEGSEPEGDVARGPSGPRKTTNPHEDAMNPSSPSIVADEPSRTRPREVLSIVSSEGSTVVARPSWVASDAGGSGGERIMRPKAVHDDHHSRNGKSILHRQNGSTADTPPTNREDLGTHPEGTSSVSGGRSDRARFPIDPAGTMNSRRERTVIPRQVSAPNRDSQPPSYASITAPVVPPPSPHAQPSTYPSTPPAAQPNGPQERRPLWHRFRDGCKNFFSRCCCWCCGM